MSKPASGDAAEQRLKVEIMHLPPKDRRRIKGISEVGFSGIQGISETSFRGYKLMVLFFTVLAGYASYAKRA